MIYGAYSQPSGEGRARVNVILGAVRPDAAR
ncbi:hypothetical protein SUDANB13_02286 [Streptomyces sp. enrichment culture]